MMRITRSSLAACFSLLVLSGPALLSGREPASAIQGKIQALADKQEVAGAVMLVADKDRVLEVSTAGFANVEKQEPMRKDALFWIASMSKPMTGAAVMMLVDEGKVRLSDPVETYLPEFKGQQLAILEGKVQTGLRPPARPITVEDVLSHTSGLPFKSPEEDPTLDALPLEKAVKTYAAQPLQFEPGSQYQYSNAGINTAARILEVVSGMKYEDFMQERLFTPLGMADTTFWPDAGQSARIAVSYKPGPENRGLVPLQIPQLHYPLSERERRFPMPAGGLFSTAADVAVFGQMILNGGEWKGRRYLSGAAVKNMLSRHTAEGLKDSYGLGWKVAEGEAGHGGAFATNLSVDFKRGLVLVYMVQHSGFPGDGKSGLALFKNAAFSAYGKR